MYVVKIFLENANDPIAEVRYNYGDFASIGHYLDYYGYIDPRYRVVITFTK